jgi:hypothetical protein
MVLEVADRWAVDKDVLARAPGCVLFLDLYLEDSGRVLDDFGDVCDVAR